MRFARPAPPRATPRRPRWMRKASRRSQWPLLAAGCKLGTPPPPRSCASPRPLRRAQQLRSCRPYCNVRASPTTLLRGVPSGPAGRLSSREASRLRASLGARPSPVRSPCHGSNGKGVKPNRRRRAIAARSEGNRGLSRPRRRDPGAIGRKRHRHQLYRLSRVALLRPRLGQGLRRRSIRTASALRRAHERSPLEPNDAQGVERP